VPRVDRRRVRHGAEALDLRAEQYALGVDLEAAVELEPVEQLETERVQDREVGGVGIVGDSLAQGQRPVRRELGHQAIRERPEALLLLVAHRRVMARGRGWATGRRRRTVGSCRRARAVLARILFFFLVFGCRHELLVLGAHIAALDVQGAVRADADEDPGTRDLRRVIPFPLNLDSGIPSKARL
jgi:hypothetical protein